MATRGRIGGLAILAVVVALLCSGCSQLVVETAVTTTGGDDVTVIHHGCWDPVRSLQLWDRDDNVLWGIAADDTQSATQILHVSAGEEPAGYRTTTPLEGDLTSEDVIVVVNGDSSDAESPEAYISVDELQPGTLTSSWDGPRTESEFLDANGRSCSFSSEDASNNLVIGIAIGGVIGGIAALLIGLAIGWSIRRPPLPGPGLWVPPLQPWVDPHLAHLPPPPPPGWNAPPATAPSGPAPPHGPGNDAPGGGSPG